MHFPISGVDLPALVPPLVGFALSVLTAPAGVSGACLLLPFQVSVLGFVSPAVSPTNLIYNIVATPGGIYRYVKEGRMAWPLAWTLIAGTLPGVFLGAVVRIRWLPDPRSFKAFAGCVLLYLGGRLLYESVRRSGRRWAPAGLRVGASVRTAAASLSRVEYEFQDGRFAFNPIAVATLALAVGLVGGIYGIGGGAIIAPFLVTILGLPVYTIAGAALLSTLMTSVAGVIFFEMLALSGPALPARPDWALGVLFGLGGLLGTYAGARLQKFLPERWIRRFLGVLLTGLSLGYLAQSL